MEGRGAGLEFESTAEKLNQHPLPHLLLTISIGIIVELVKLVLHLHECSVYESEVWDVTNYQQVLNILRNCCKLKIIKKFTFARFEIFKKKGKCISCFKNCKMEVVSLSRFLKGNFTSQLQTLLYLYKPKKTEDSALILRFSTHTEKRTINLKNKSFPRSQGLHQ